MSTFPERLSHIKHTRNRQETDQAPDRIGILRQDADDQDATREALDRTGLSELKRIARHLNEAGFAARTSAVSQSTGTAFACTLTVDGLGEITCALGVRKQSLLVRADPPFTRGASLIFNIGDRLALGNTIEQWVLEQLTLDREAPRTYLR